MTRSKDSLLVNMVAVNTKFKWLFQVSKGHLPLKSMFFSNCLSVGWDRHSSVNMVFVKAVFCFA